jgi:beta-N-acetylhexosaminidase
MPPIRDEIGQLLMVGIAGEEPTAEERRTIKEHRFGGFILFGRNCRAPDQLTNLCRLLWRTARELPPLIGIDHEGGRVHRLPEPFTRFPAARAIGRSGNPELAYRTARAMATELALAGINLNFAPVLDVDSNPRNPVIAERSFADKPREVMRFTRKFIEGLRAGGIIPCGKHFPGHGGSAEDSHVELPRVDRTVAELKRVELAPFAHACRQRIESLMTAHVAYPALDGEVPATLSSKIITGLLRRQWHYNGVVFSDDMDMAAVSGIGGAEQGLLAVRAGVDVLLYGRDLARAVETYELMLKKTERDARLRARVRMSFLRLRALKRRFLKSFTGAPASQLSRRLAEVDHQRLCRDIQGSLYAV